MGKKRYKRVIRNFNINVDALQNADEGGLSTRAEGTDMYFFDLINQQNSWAKTGMETILGLTKEFWKNHNVEMTEENEESLGKIIWSEGCLMDYLKYKFEKNIIEREDIYD